MTKAKILVVSRSLGIDGGSLRCSFRNIQPLKRAALAVILCYNWWTAVCQLSRGNWARAQVHQPPAVWSDWSIVSLCFFPLAWRHYSCIFFSSHSQVANILESVPCDKDLVCVWHGCLLICAANICVYHSSRMKMAVATITICLGLEGDHMY